MELRDAISNQTVRYKRGSSLRYTENILTKYSTALLAGSIDGRDRPSLVQVGLLPRTGRRLIEQLFWDERTPIEVADAMGTYRSTVNRRKRAILNGLRVKLRDQNEFQRFPA